MTARHLLMLCFVLTAYGADLVPPLETFSASPSKSPTNVSTYLTQTTAKAIVDLTGFADRSFSPGRSRSYMQGKSLPQLRLATTPRSPPLLTDSIADVQRDPNLFTDHADPAPATHSSYDKPIIAGKLSCPLVSHGPDTSDMKDFTKRLTSDDGPKKDTKPKMLTPGQKCIWIVVVKKHALANKCGNGPALFHTMTRTCIAPTYHSDIPPPPSPLLSFCCELLYVVTLILISISLVVSIACAFGFDKRFNKLTGLKIPCRELLFVFLTLFPAPGAAATQGMVTVYTNASASTNVTSWAQLVTACDAPSANITLSPVFQMGAYTNEIDFRLVLSYVV
jgi:hypothetical protein